MTQPDIQINFEAMRRHARVVDETSTMIDAGAQAGAWVRASNDAYGLMFGWFAARLNPTRDDLVGGINQAATAAQTLADGPGPRDDPARQHRQPNRPAGRRLGRGPPSCGDPVQCRFPYG